MPDTDLSRRSFARSLVDPIDTTEQPTGSFAQIGLLVNAVLVLVMAFGVELTQDQTVAIMGVVNILLVVLGSWHLWGKVTPNTGSGRFIPPEEEHADHEAPAEFHGGGDA